MSRAIDRDGYAGVIISVVDNLLFIVMLSSNWNLLAEGRRSKASSSLPSSAKKHPPDVEAPAINNNAVQADRHSRGGSRHPKHGKQRQPDAEPPTSGTGASGVHR